MSDTAGQRWMRCARSGISYKRRLLRCQGKRQQRRAEKGLKVRKGRKDCKVDDGAGERIRVVRPRVDGKIMVASHLAFFSFFFE